MIFIPSIDNSLNLVCLNLAMYRKTFGREKEAKFFSLSFSKLKSIEIAEGPIVHKVSELIHAWFTLKGKVEKISCCPVNQLKFFDVQ